jgi:acetyl-CoA acetyltransferase
LSCGVADHTPTAEVVVSARNNGVTNPDAFFRSAITVADHHDSRMISDPLRLLDCCMESDGAGAVIVAASDRARALRQKPISIMGASTAASYRWGEGTQNNHNMPAADYPTGGQRATAEELFRMAGAGPKDMDVALV